MAANAQIQLLGNGVGKLLGEYPVWKELTDGAAEAAAKGWTQIAIKKDMLSNTKGKDYSNARLGTIKLTPCEHAVALPEGKQVVRVVVHGFSNSEQASLLSAINGQPVHYTFPGKNYNPVYTTHV